MKIEIIFENEDLIVCIKPVGVSSQLSDKENMITLLKNQLDLSDDPFVVHRLDTAVSGLMVYAKSLQTAKILSSQIQDHTFKKEYLCVVHSKPDKDSGRFTDHLFKDSKKNKSFVVNKLRKGVKEAVLDYEVVASKEYNGETLSLIKVDLLTGRTHQIRVQFSSRRMPLYGDGKYGGKDNCNIALYSSKIEFEDKDKNHHVFSSSPTAFPFDIFKKRTRFIL